MADDTKDKVYTPEVIPDQPFPQEGEEVSASQPSGGTGVYTQESIRPTPVPKKRIAQELLGSALNTKSRKILAAFEFAHHGAIQVGKYENGISGDIRLSPSGIVARNQSGLTTFALDGDTGDATFRGTVQAGSVIAATIEGENVIADTLSAISSLLGTVDVGGAGNGNGILRVKDATGVEKVTLNSDGITITNGDLVINDTEGTTIIDGTGLVSGPSFANDSVTDSNAFTTTSASFVDVTNMTLTFNLAREANVLIGASVVGRNDQITTTDPYTAITQLVVDSNQVGGYMVTPGFPATNGIANMTGATSIIVTLAAGSHTVKLQLTCLGYGVARLVASNPKTLWYVVLGK